MINYNKVIRTYTTDKNTSFNILEGKNSIGETFYFVSSINENGDVYNFRTLSFSLGDADSFLKDLLDSFNEGYSN